MQGSFYWEKWPTGRFKFTCQICCDGAFVGALLSIYDHTRAQFSESPVPWKSLHHLERTSQLSLQRLVGLSSCSLPKEKSMPINSQPKSPNLVTMFSSRIRGFHMGLGFFCSIENLGMWNWGRHNSWYIYSFTESNRRRGERKKCVNVFIRHVSETWTLDHYTSICICENPAAIVYLLALGFDKSNFLIVPFLT